MSNFPAERLATLRFGEYQPQRIFPFRYTHGTTVEDDISIINCMVEGIALAKDIVSTGLSRRTLATICLKRCEPVRHRSDLPPRQEVLVDPEETMLALIDQWLRCDTFVVVFDDLEEGTYAITNVCGDEGDPCPVKIEYSLVESAAAAQRILGRDHLAAQAALLHLAVVVGHELCHVARHELTPTWMDDTPPSIRTGSGITGDSDDLVIGESGWFWEEAVLGGSISRVLAVEGDKGYTVDGQVDVLVVRLLDKQPVNGQVRYFEVANERIGEIIGRKESLDTVLPLRPERAGSIQTGRLKHVKWRYPSDGHASSDPETSGSSRPERPIEVRKSTIHPGWKA